MKLINLMRGARRLVEYVANVRTGENVLIVTDTNKTDLAEALGSAVHERNAEAVITVMTPRLFHAADVPKAVRAAINSADVIFAPTTVSASALIRKYANPDARGVSLAGWRYEQFVSGGLFANFDELKPEVDKIVELLDNTEIAHITSEAGTDVTVALKKGARAGYGGIAREAGSYCSCPIVEAIGAIDIGNSETEGEIVVDGSLCLDMFSPLRQPVSIIITEGRIEEIRGGWYARMYKNYLRDLNDSTVYNLVEFAFGMNPEAKCVGWFSEDEGAGGSNHFGIGGWNQPGSTGVHLDFVCLDTTCELDGKLIKKEGKILV